MPAASGTAIPAAVVVTLFPSTSPPPARSPLSMLKVPGPWTPTYPPTSSATSRVSAPTPFSRLMNDAGRSSGDRYGRSRIAVHCGIPARQSARTSQLRSVPAGSSTAIVLMTPFSGAAVEKRAHNPCCGRPNAAPTLITSSATIARRTSGRARNAGSSQTSAGSTTPTSTASARPFNGMPSNVESNRPGQSIASARTSVHSGVPAVTGDPRTRPAAAPPQPCG